MRMRPRRHPPLRFAPSQPPTARPLTELAWEHTFTACHRPLPQLSLLRFSTLLCHSRGNDGSSSRSTRRPHAHTDCLRRGRGRSQNRKMNAAARHRPPFASPARVRYAHMHDAHAILLTAHFGRPCACASMHAYGTLIAHAALSPWARLVCHQACERRERTLRARGGRAVSARRRERGCA